ncbi:helix-turn-helix transcriptional regulator [Dactylosporangium sp. NPDC000244]|uniref:helix-turn-helix domain-containing protein n=1 Tax=Dactylosporangium sp. NPDC000244 TaxID=3154365 RepID=UPI00331CB354
MSSGDAPAAARRKVRLAIKDARSQKGDTQSQVAEAMEWSLSKVMRIESGEVTISANDLRPLLSYLGIKDRDTVEDLIQAAKSSKRQRRQWWDDRRYQDMLTPALRQLISFEAEATVIRSFAPAAIPGWLQTEAYALAVTSGFVGDLTDDEIRTRAEIRTARWKALRDRAPRPKLFALFDESVLLRRYGGAEALGEALSAVSSAIAEGWLSVRLHPLSSPYPPFGQYDLLYLSSEDNSHAVLYRESYTIDEIVDDSVRISRHREGWDRMWDASIGEVESARRIAAAAKAPATADLWPADEGSSA